MATRTTKIYLVHAEGDDAVREKLVGQAREARLAVEFAFLPAKQPWVAHWKGMCRTKVMQCDGAIVLLTKRAQEAGLKTELDFVNEAQMPVLGVYMDQHRGSVPEQLRDTPIIDWNWPEIVKFVQSLNRPSFAGA